MSDTLPELTPGEVDETVTCQHILTAQDVAEWTADREAHLAQFRATTGHDMPTWMALPVVPDEGQPCGLDLYVAVEEIDYRRGAYWTADGGVVIGKSDNVETTEVRMYCGRHGAWNVPDVEDWA